jgi:ABC-type branched-subunit amino acid transport system substrate-binding protein
MGLAGDLREISFSDVVQFYYQGKRTALLVVSCPRSGQELGYFYFDQGELFDARLGELEGLEAVYRAMELQEGVFHVIRDVKTPHRRIFKPFGAMLLEGLRRLEEASSAPDRPAPQLKLVPSPAGGDDGEQLEGEDMAIGDHRERVCPTCRKHFQHGDVCPKDGSRLVTVSGGLEVMELTPASGTVQPASILPRRSRLATSWWIAIIALLTVVTAFGIVWLRRSGVLSSADRTAASATGASGGEASGANSGGAAGAATGAPGKDPLVGAVRGVSDKEIVFGLAGPLTGPAKELGRQMKLGVETAFHATNAAGGVHGRQLRLVALDDGYEPTRTATVMTELYEKEKVFGIVGNVGTPTAAVAVPYALERKMLFYGAFTGANLLRRDPPDRYVVNFRASYAEETATVVKYLVKVRRIRPGQIAVFAQQDSFGDAGFAGVQKAMRALRSDDGPVLRVGYVRNTIDVAEAVQKIVDHPIAIKAIVMVGTYRACAKFIEKIRDIHPKMILTNVSFVGSTALAEELKLLGPKYADGVIVTQVVPPVESHSTAILKYKSALENYFPGETPDYVSLEGFLAATVLVEALRRAGRELDTERLINAFEGIRGLELGIGTQITFGVAEHQGSHKVWGTQLDAQGRYEVLDLE